MNDSSTQCRWTVGWKTPTWMGTTFALACLIVILHSVLFVHLAGKPADGPDAPVSQTYSTTASMIMSTIFGLSLRFSLGLSFTQHLWHLLRSAPHKASTIDGLFMMRSNPLLLFDPLILRKAWPLVLSAIVIYGTTIAPTFPPGAMTVAQSVQEHVVPDAVVPTFNASDVGDMTYVHLARTSLADLQMYNNKFVSSIVAQSNNYASPSVQYLIRRTLTTKSLWEMPSPCGANCTYTVRFVGPYLQCTDHYKNVTREWNATEKTSSTPALSFATYDSLFDLNATAEMLTSSTFSSITTSRLHISTTMLNGSLGVKDVRKFLDDSTPGSNIPGIPFDSEPVSMTVRQYRLNTTEHHLECVPSRVEYTVHTSYEKNIRYLSASVDSSTVEPLTPALSGLNINGTLTETTVLDASTAPFFRDLNIYALIQQVAHAISGSLNESSTAIGDPTERDKEGFSYYSTRNSLIYNKNNQSTVDVLLQYFSRLDLSTDFSELVSVNRELLSVNQTALNSMLVDTTLSLIPFRNIWTTTVNQTRTQLINVYAFSKPTNFILPYALTLAGGLCVLALGYHSLYTNGVSAADGGFLQLLTTTRGSATVERAIRGACLGGEENVPTALKDLRIQYGELIPDESEEKYDLLRTAGFGTPGEVRELNRSHSYGG